MFLTLRYWLIRIVVGRVQVVANVSVTGCVELHKGPAYIWSSKLKSDEPDSPAFRKKLESIE